MDDEELRKLAWASALAITTFGADEILKEVVTEAESGRFAWQSFPSPSGMRAFEGKSDTYVILVVQANIVGVGVSHRATATARVPRKFSIVNLPVQIADYLYHLASSLQN